MTALALLYEQPTVSMERIDIADAVRITERTNEVTT